MKMVVLISWLSFDHDAGSMTAMISMKSLDIAIIIFAVVLAIICITILSILRCRLLNEKNSLKKSYAALLLDSDHHIDKIIPIHHKQILENSACTEMCQTQTMHPSVETDEDYYHAILATNDTPYFFSRETKICPFPRRTNLKINIHQGNDLVEI